MRKNWEMETEDTGSHHQSQDEPRKLVLLRSCPGALAQSPVPSSSRVMDYLLPGHGCAHPSATRDNPKQLLAELASSLCTDTATLLQQFSADPGINLLLWKALGGTGRALGFKRVQQPRCSPWGGC